MGSLTNLERVELRDVLTMLPTPANRFDLDALTPLNRQPQSCPISRRDIVAHVVANY